MNPHTISPMLRLELQRQLGDGAEDGKPIGATREREAKPRESSV